MLVVFRVDQRMLQGPDAGRFIDYEIEKIEKDAIYQAVKQVDGWICILPEIEERRADWNTIEYRVKVNVRDVRIEKVYVFPEAYPVSQIPKDLYRCDYCGGHTKNDMRGHCAACGGPRKEYTWDH